MTDLTHKLCLVTGAARGIGEAVAERFIAGGARVVVTDKNETAGAATARRLGCAWHPLDVADESDWAQLIHKWRSS